MLSLTLIFIVVVKNISFFVYVVVHYVSMAVRTTASMPAL